MARFFTTHWQFKFWNSDHNGGTSAMRSSGSNQYRARGVAHGDHVYVVSLSDGMLYLGGRIVVDRVVSRKEAIRILQNSRLHESSDWIIGVKELGTKLNLRRRLSPELTRQLRFVAPSGELKPPFFVSDTKLDVQATRGVRELSPNSAALLEQILIATDSSQEQEGDVTVTLADVEPQLHKAAEIDARLPNEPSNGETFSEGSLTQVYVNRYERDPRVRQACFASQGTRCVVCCLEYSDMYGPDFAGFAHVHHVLPLSNLPEGYRVDPAKDVVPICPNCHAAVHRRNPPYELEELRQLILAQATRES